jgi:hypothetical protein
MRKTLMFILVTLLTSQAGCLAEGAWVNPKFRPYVEMFEEEFDTDVSDINVQFGQPANGWAAECRNIWTRPTITVDREMFERHNGFGRMSIIFHELGHCKFGLSHAAETFDDGSPVSVMNDPAPSDDVMKKDHDYYVDEMHARIDDPDRTCPIEFIGIC